MHLDQWLREVYDEEISKEASGIEVLFAQMDPSDILDIACGRSSVEKVAAKMTQERRNDLSSKSFAIPQAKAKKIGVAGEIKGEAKGKYPIPDEKHARNALSRVSTFGSPAERAAVRKKVYGKFPALRSGFEERHSGASPTSKGNLTKPTQGSISKSAQVRLVFMDKVARQIARQHVEVAKQAACGMTKSDEFTSPEAQQKAKAMQSAMKSTKGAPTKVRKGAIKVVGREVNKIAGSLSSARRFRLEDKARRLISRAGRPTRKSKLLMGKAQKAALKQDLQSGRRFREGSPFWNEV